MEEGNCVQVCPKVVNSCASFLLRKLRKATQKNWFTGKDRISIVRQSSNQICNYVVYRALARVIMDSWLTISKLCSC
jgi:hypothetical protein